MSKSKSKKLALILSGGGMTTSYSVGVLQAFRKKYKINPDILIAASGSAGTATYFVSKQDKIMEHFWMDLIPQNENIVNAFRFSKIIDIDFIVDVLMKEQASCDIEKLKSSKIDLFIPTVNSKTGKIKYFTNRDDVDWYEVLRAAKAIPIAYGKEVKIKNQYYHDSFSSSKSKTHIDKAVKEGATHVLVVNVTRFHKRYAILESVLNLFTKSMTFRRNYRLLSKSKKFPKIQIVATFPSKEPEASMLDIRADDIEETMLLGYQDAQKDPIKTFVSDFKKF